MCAYKLNNARCIVFQLRINTFYLISMNSRSVAAYTQERVRVRTHYFHPKISVFQTIMCRIVSVQLSFIMSTQSNLKSFTKYA